MGCLIEGPGIYGSMTAAENLEVKCRLTGIRRKGYVEELLQIVGLSQTGRKKAKHFSMGMRQRLGIALALVGEPDLLVLDEPINGLDPQGIAEIRDMVLRLNEERNMTIIISSHILEELSKIATDYGIIHQGVLIKEMTREELMRRCSERIEIQLEEPEKALPVLDAMGFHAYQVADKNHIHVFERLEESAALNMELAKAGVAVTSLSITSEDLETYFLNLTEVDSMLNALRMEAYRMRKTVSTWMVFLVLAALTVGTTFILRGEYQDAGVQQANYEYMESSEANENQNLGMSVTLPTEPGHRVTLYDFFYANSQGKFLALFFCIYAVMYTGADRKSGYIKAIGAR